MAERRNRAAADRADVGRAVAGDAQRCQRLRVTGEVEQAGGVGDGDVGGRRDLPIRQRLDASAAEDREIAGHGDDAGRVRQFQRTGVDAG